MQHLLAKVAKAKNVQDLTWEEAKQAMRLMIEGTATPAQVGAFTHGYAVQVRVRHGAGGVYRHRAAICPARAGACRAGVVDVPVYAGKARNVSRHRACCDHPIIAAAARRVVAPWRGWPAPTGVCRVLKLLGIPVDLTRQAGRAGMERTLPTWIWPCIARP